MKSFTPQELADYVNDRFGDIIATVDAGFNVLLDYEGNGHVINDCLVSHDHIYPFYFLSILDDGKFEITTSKYNYEGDHTAIPKEDYKIEWDAYMDNNNVRVPRKVISIKIQYIDRCIERLAKMFNKTAVVPTEVEELVF